MSDASKQFKKERHGFLTFWLIFGIVVNLISLFFVAIAMDKPDLLSEMEISKSFAFMCVVIYFVSCICGILLLNWKITGFYLYCITAVISCIVYPVTSTFVFAIFGPLLDFAFLQLKENGISAWTHLTGNYSNLDNMADIESDNENEYKKCPFCAENIKKEAVVCRFCQRQIDQVT